MILGSGKQLLSIVVFGFALMGFIAVPIFDQSAYEHLRDLLTSEKAQTAGQQISDSLEDVKDQITREIGERSNASASEQPQSSQSLARQGRRGSAP